MTPAETLRRAADIVEHRHEYRDHLVQTQHLWLILMPDAVAAPLVAWLRETAEVAHPAGCGCLPCIDGLHANALDFAQRVLAAAGEERYERDTR